MKEIKQIVEAYQKVDFSKTKLAMATVVRVEGSAYRRTGARMLVLETGEWIGGISGGCLEGDALKKARLVMNQNIAKMVTYDTTEDDPYQIGVSLGCNGIIDVLITPLDPSNTENAVAVLEKCIGMRQPNLLATVTGIDGHHANLVLGQVFRYTEKLDFAFLSDKIINDQITLDAQMALENGSSVAKTFTLLNGTQLSLFLEVILPETQILICGASYDVYPTVRVAKELGWQVICITNPVKMHKSLFDMADEVQPKDYQPQVDQYTVAISMWHDFENDYQNLLNLLKTNIAYIGLLGPKKRTEKMRLRLIEEGENGAIIDDERIHSPVGLDIGAANPEEIAIAIVAEIISFIKKREGGSLRIREKPIYEN